MTVEIRREELGALMGEKYPTADHRKLNLPGLLFLQSSPALQNSSAILLRRKHKLNIPDGRRTLRYIFHVTVDSIDARREKIRINFDPGKLPKSAHEYLHYEPDRELDSRDENIIAASSALFPLISNPNLEKWHRLKRPGAEAPRAISD